MAAEALVKVGEGDLSAMLDLLEAERRLYEDLSGLARRKQEVLVEGRLSELEGLIEREKETLRGVAAVEEERFALQCRLAGALGLEPAELTVTRLAESAGPPFGARLTQAQQALVGLIDELSTLNQCNTEMIQQSLAYVDFVMGLLAGGRSAETYGRRGERPRPSHLGLFSRNA